MSGKRKSANAGYYAHIPFNALIRHDAAIRPIAVSGMAELMASDQQNFAGANLATIIWSSR
jgi:hypothetical protein